MPDELEPVPQLRPLTPLGLYEKALERGVDASELGKLLDLQRTWDQDRAREAYFRSMNDCQGMATTVVKDAENKHTRSWYARLETVAAQLTPVITRFGFSLSFSEGECPREGMIRVVCTVMHKGGHSEVHHGDFPADGTGAKGGQAAMNPVQGVGSTYSYARRYLMCSIFNVVVAGEDTDAGRDSAAVTADQVAEVNTLIDECADAGNPVDFQRFLKWLKVADLEKLDQRGFAKAIQELNRKRRMKKEVPA